MATPIPTRMIGPMAAPGSVNRFANVMGATQGHEERGERSVLGKASVAGEGTGVACRVSGVSRSVPAPRLDPATFGAAVGQFLHRLEGNHSRDGNDRRE